MTQHHYADDSDDAIVARALAVLEARMTYGNKICSSKDAINYMTLKLSHEPRELFAVLFMDSQHRVLAFEILFMGTINTTPVYPREVVKRALFHNAGAVLFAHNHPSGDPTPSESDRTITMKLRDALALVDVRVLDHIVVGGGSAVSAAEQG